MGNPGYRLERCVVGGVELGVLCGTAYCDTQVSDLVKREGWRISGCGDDDKVGAIDIFEVKRRALIRLRGLDLDVAHLQMVDMAKEEALSRSVRAEHTRIGIFLCIFG